MMKHRSKKAVSPVLATLMMVAVAVAMSVIIFTWSQSFLSQTSEAASGQQASQNIAAQSGILIEAVTATQSASGSNGTATIYVRNVGGVSIELGSISVVGRPSNSKFKGSISIPQLTTGDNYYYVSSSYRLKVVAPADLTIGRGYSKTMTVNFAQLDDANYPNHQLTAGDMFTVKVTTKAGTFAQATYTVP
jgi:flagellin-like protein